MLKHNMDLLFSAYFFTVFPLALSLRTRENTGFSRIPIVYVNIKIGKLIF